MVGNSTPAVRQCIFKAVFDAVPKHACHQTPVWAGTTVTTDEPGTVRNAEGEQDRCSCQGERSSEPGKSGHQAGTANSGSHGKGGSAIHPHPHLENSGCGHHQRPNRTEHDDRAPGAPDRHKGAEQDRECGKPAASQGFEQSVQASRKDVPNGNEFSCSVTFGAALATGQIPADSFHRCAKNEGFEGGHEPTPAFASASRMAWNFECCGCAGCVTFTSFVIAFLVGITRSALHLPHSARPAP